ncbi:hypothetical protein ACFQQB_57765 [Nonomuraea rubra]|uniref:hypothetical protein n=1 Tax=Nonomuraea rubra TaxID=46180 RepID=UPI00361F6F82
MARRAAVSDWRCSVRAADRVTATSASNSPRIVSTRRLPSAVSAALATARSLRMARTSGTE